MTGQLRRHVLPPRLRPGWRAAIKSARWLTVAAALAGAGLSIGLRIEAWVDDEVAVEQRREPDAADQRQVICRLPARRPVDAAERDAQRQRMAARLELARKAERDRRELSASSAPAVKPSDGRGRAARAPQDAR